MERFLMLFVIFFPALCALVMPALRTDRAKGGLLTAALALEAAAVFTLLPCKGAELTLENATSIATVPYHEGAASYYAEHGIQVKTQEQDRNQEDL